MKHTTEVADEKGRKFISINISEIKDDVKLINTKIENLSGVFKFSTPSDKDTFEFDNSKWSIKTLYCNTGNQRTFLGFDMGWVVIKNNELAFIVSIYEPHGFSENAKRGLVTFDGHEEIINLWLDNGEYKHNYTR